LPAAQAPASGGIGGALFGALGINPSNIGGTGVGFTNGGLNIPGLGTIKASADTDNSVSTPQTPAMPQMHPLSMALPQRKPIDMRGIYALAQQQPLGI
jgi:hypothetical protein